MAQDQETGRERVHRLGTEIDDSGVPWALLAREQNGALQFAGPATIRPTSHIRAEWREVRQDVDREPCIEGVGESQQGAMSEGSELSISRPKATRDRHDWSESMLRTMSALSRNFLTAQMDWISSHRASTFVLRFPGVLRNLVERLWRPRT